MGSRLPGSLPALSRKGSGAGPGRGLWPKSWYSQDPGPASSLWVTLIPSLCWATFLQRPSLPLPGQAGPARACDAGETEMTTSVSSIVLFFILLSLPWLPEAAPGHRIHGGWTLNSAGYLLGQGENIRHLGGKSWNLSSQLRGKPRMGCSCPGPLRTPPGGA